MPAFIHNWSFNRGDVFIWLCQFCVVWSSRRLVTHLPKYFLRISSIDHYHQCSREMMTDPDTEKPDNYQVVNMVKHVHDGL